MSGPGRGRGSIVVVGEPDGLSSRIGARLAELGMGIVTVDKAVELADLLTTMTAGGDAVSAVVHVVIDAATIHQQPLVELDEATWEASAEAPVVTALGVLQTARRLAARPCRMVLVVPSVGMNGQTGLVALSTASEALRALAKSAARSWGGDGTTVNIVAVDADSLVSSPLSGATNLSNPPLAGEGAGDVADAVAMLCGESAARVTGATIFADAGRTMLP